jgi:hypothetical protein
MATTTRTRFRRSHAASQWNLRSILADALVFVIALISSYTVHFVGDLPVAEIILIPLVPIIWVLRKRQPVPPALRTILFLMGLWLFGQILTDLYRGSATVDWMRGDAAIVFFAFDLAGLTVLLAGNEHRKAVFLAGLGIGVLMVARFAPSAFAQGERWKFGYASGTITLVLLASCFFYSRRRYLLATVLFVGIIGANLLENYRSPVLNLLIAMVLVIPIVPERIGRLRLLPRVGSVMRVAVLAGMVVAAGSAASALVHFVTSRGLISEEAREKNESQSQGTGLLLGGRPEILISSRAVLDSPILGHGSWAKDPKYQEMLSDMMVEQGHPGNLGEMEKSSLNGLIPAHSHLMGSWVDAGILGAVFWSFILWLVIKGIVRVTVLRPPLAPISAYLLVEYSWAILFSPFGSTMRMYESMVIVIMMDLLDSAPHLVRALPPFRKRAWRRRPFRGHIPAAVPHLPKSRIAGPGN